MPNVPRVVLTSSYDAAGNRTSLAATIIGMADFKNTYNYDALSRVTQIEQSGVTNGNTVAYKELDYTFDPLGDVTSRAAYSQANTPRSDAATGQYGYNSLGQLTSLGYTSNAGTTAIDNFGWSFDSLGRVSTFSSIDGTATYGYDSVNEVTSAVYSTNSGGHQPTNESYNFDANGNRTNVDGTGTTLGVNNEVANDGTYAYTFDAEGNRLTEAPDSGAPSSDHPASFTYDYRNRLVEVQEFNNATPPTLTEQINYVYDVFDRLIERDDDVIGGSTTTTNYVWDGSNVVLAFNGSQALTARYLNGPNTSAYDQYFTTLAEEDVIEGKLTFDLVDQLGSNRDIVNSSGQLVDHLNYNSFGQLVSQTTPSVTHIDGYAGGFYDPSTGLLYFINRWYDPTATVWISADPMGFTAGDSNLTRYVTNDPANLNDPPGLFGWSGHGEITRAGIKRSGAVLFKPGYYAAISQQTDLEHTVDPEYHAQSSAFVDKLQKLMNIIKTTTCDTVEGQGKVMYAMGQALHILQDFYSHTDWIEGKRMYPVYRYYIESHAKDLGEAALVKTGRNHEPHNQTLDLDALAAGDDSEVADLLYFTGGYFPFGKGSQHNRYATDSAGEGRDSDPEAGIKGTRIQPVFGTQGLSDGLAYERAREFAIQQTSDFLVWAYQNMRPECRCMIFLGAPTAGRGFLTAPLSTRAPQRARLYRTQTLGGD